MFVLDQQIVVGGICILVALYMAVAAWLDLRHDEPEAEDASVSDVDPTQLFEIRVHGVHCLAHD